MAVLPGLFWLFYFRRKDSKNDPEPLKLVFKIFLWGGLMTIPATALEFAADFFFPFTNTNSYIVLVFSALLIVAPIEEFLKYIIVREKIYNNKEFNEPVDGIIYCVAAALGFATFENILVVFGDGGQNSILLRFATATLMHAITSGIAGFYLGRAKFFGHKKDATLINRGLIYAILIHAAYNIIVSTSMPVTFGVLVFFMFFIYFLLSSKIKELKKIRPKLRLAKG